jgi:hypothetical protein
VRIRLSPNPFEGGKFKQQLILEDGNIVIEGKNKSLTTKIILWVDVFAPVIHVEIKSNQPINTEAFYESWRYKNRQNIGKANNANSYKWAPQGDILTYKDEVTFKKQGILFYHHNLPETVFDVTVKQQGMEAVKNPMFNPLKYLTFGGWIRGDGMIPAGKDSGTYIDTDFECWKLRSSKPSVSQNIQIYLHTQQAAKPDDWQGGLLKTILQPGHLHTATINWWRQFWQKSFIHINSGSPDTASLRWQSARNYQLFRYMLACNTYGSYPTKFNGGLFTYDPSLTDTSLKFTPDFRNWGGGTHTAQNQRLVYYPMIKSGDFDMMKPQFNFYLRCLTNAELRCKVYWGHPGSCFTEQLENFGLPNPAEYGWNRPATFDKGVEFNKWLEYEWDTVLEFCLMMLQQEEFADADIGRYIPFIESCLTFFYEHYHHDENGKLVLYPGSAAETYKLATNSTSTISALQTILSKLLALPSKYLNEKTRSYFTNMLKAIPPLSFATFNGHQTIAPAKSWERINNSEVPQLYPVFPWGIYGIGKANVDVALNTWRFDTNAIKFRSYIGWKQDNIFAARLGLTKEAAELTVSKLKNSGRRFPAFWGPGYDWAPDHNWGGTGMIGLQEMLMQVDGEKIYLFPAWPKEWDVHFKLHAPHNTIVEAILVKGNIVKLVVLPASRKKDVILL